MRGGCHLLVFLLITTSGTGCTRRLGVSRMADAISATANAYTRDDDPEFVRLAAPSTLKMIEMLLDEVPAHRGLLLSACSGFAQYSYAFLQNEADRVELSDPAGARDLRGQSARMYERAKGYCFRALDAAHPGLSRSLPTSPASALAKARKEDVPVLYWTAVAWGGAVALSENALTRVSEMGAVRTLLGRALELDEGWESGAVHEAMIAIEGLPALLGGSPARARSHFDRAVALARGESAFAYVALATSVAQPAKDRAEFERVLRQAQAVDVSRRPSLRLANLIAQRRARFLLAQADRLFRAAPQEP